MVMLNSKIALMRSNDKKPEDENLVALFLKLKI